MPPKALLKRGASVAWEQAAREATRQNRDLRRVSAEGQPMGAVGSAGSEDSFPRTSRRNNTAGSHRSIVSIGSARRSSSKNTEEGYFQDRGALDFGSPGPQSHAPLSGLHLKAMAARLRKKVHHEALEKRSSTGSYAALGGEGLRTEGPEAGGEVSDLEGKVVAAGIGGGGTWDALCSIFYHPFSLLLLAFPLGIVSHVRRWGAVSTFWLNILALVPLAKILGDGTEELAAALGNDTISGLLNATLGNAVELIITVQTLRKGLLDVVKATLLGSILSNILLVLGTSFFLGGLISSSSMVGKHHVIYDEAYDTRRCGCTAEKEQIFSSKSALVSMAMQLVACMTIALPTVFSAASPSDSLSVDGLDGKEARDFLLLKVSRISAIIIMVSYVAFISFQLVTHKRMLTIDEGADSDDEGGDDAGLSTGASLTLMTVTTLVIAVSTEMLVGAIEDVVAHSHLSASFIGIVLLPFAGNACEHASAIRFAIQDRPGLSIGIAVGSSTQIALFVVPFAVLMGWIFDKPMDLDFGVMNTTVMLLSVLVALALVIDGRSHWLKGFMLCTAYAFEAVLYWYSSAL